MTDHQKKALGNYEVNTRFHMPDGGSMSLSYILETEIRNNNLTGISLPEFKTVIHPCLYYLFLIDWSKIIAKRIPSKFKGDGIVFGRAVINDWLDICGKNRYYKYNMLDNYESITQFREIMDRMLNDKLQYLDIHRNPSIDYVNMEERMYSIRQQFLDTQRAEDLKAEEERKLAEAADRKRREAERKAAKNMAGAAAPSQSAPVPAASPAGSPSPVAVGSAAATIETMVLETQRLLSQVPDLTPTITLAVFPERESLPFASILQWDDDSRYSFYGNSFADTITPAKDKASQLIDHEIRRREREQQRILIQQQMDEQKALFDAKMAETQKMMKQLQQQIADQQALHQKNMSTLQQQLTAL